MIAHIRKLQEAGGKERYQNEAGGNSQHGAIAVIGEMGVSGLTTARLAEWLGMSESNLYRHFNGKEAILSAVIDEIGVLLMDNAVLIAGEKIPPEEKLMLIMASHVSEVEQKKRPAEAGFFGGHST